MSGIVNPTPREFISEVRSLCQEGSGRRSVGRFTGAVLFETMEPLGFLSAAGGTPASSSGQPFRSAVSAFEDPYH